MNDKQILIHRLAINSWVFKMISTLIFIASMFIINSYIIIIPLVALWYLDSFILSVERKVRDLDNAKSQNQLSSIKSKRSIFIMFNKTMLIFHSSLIVAILLFYILK